AAITALFNGSIVDSIAYIEADIQAKSTLTIPISNTVNNRADLQSQATVLYTFFKDFFNLTFTDNDPANSATAEKIHAKYVGDKSNFHGLLQTLSDYNHYSMEANSNAPSPAWDAALITDDFSADFTPLTIATAASKNDIYTATATAVNAAPYFVALLGKLTALVNSFYTELSALRSSRTENLEQI